MIELSVGQPYPLPLSQDEGAAAQFLTKQGNLLQVALPGMSAREELALRTGAIKAGFLYESGGLLWLFQFFDGEGKPVVTLDAPFDIRLLPEDQRTLHSITNQKQRLSIELHGIDNGILRALRLVTMPHTLTVDFLSAVQEQLTSTRGGRQMAVWMQYPATRLIEKTTMYKLGT